MSAFTLPLNKPSNDSAHHSGVLKFVKGVYTPSSNTGCSGSALIDYLTVTCSRLELPKLNLRDIGTANAFLKFLFSSSSLIARDFEDKSFLGYTQSADIYGPDCQQPCGKVAIGGNNDTCIISLSGAGCPFIGEAAQVLYDLKNASARITRIDLAVDDFAGKFIDVHVAHYFACEGVFTPKRGSKPNLEFISDCCSGRGCTLYVGTRGATQLCIYEKGKKEGDKLSLWTRIEVRLWSKNRTIPLDILINTLAYMRGAYPALQDFIPLNHEAKRAATTRNQIKSSAEAQARWLSDVAGRTLRLLQGAMQPAQFDIYIQNLSRDGLPRRFKHLPKIVTEKLIQEHANSQIPEPCYEH